MTLSEVSLEHLQKHIVYPATKKEIIEACNTMMDVPKKEKEWFEKNLPDWTYRNADEVIRAIEIVEHLGHVSYPTTRKELVEACDNMTDVPEAYREWFERNLPERTFGDPEDVIRSFKL